MGGLKEWRAKCAEIFSHALILHNKRQGTRQFTHCESTVDSGQAQQSMHVNRPVFRGTVLRFRTYSRCPTFTYFYPAFADCQADWREIARLSYSQLKSCKYLSNEHIQRGTVGREQRAEEERPAKFARCARTHAHWRGTVSHTLVRACPNYAQVMSRILAYNPANLATSVPAFINHQLTPMTHTFKFMLSFVLSLYNSNIYKEIRYHMS